MAREPNQVAGEAASQAMQRALEAEERAREAVEGCQHQANRLRDQARADADRIQKRADDRIDWVHRHCARILEGRLGELRGQEPDAADPDPWGEADVLAAAAEELAAALTQPEATDEPEGNRG